MSLTGSNSARAELEDKRVFLVVSASDDRRALFAKWIEKHITNSTVHVSADGRDALFKLENAPPHVLVIDAKLPKLDGLDVVDQILKKRNPAKKKNEFSIVISFDLPDKEHFVDDVVRGQVQFVPESVNEIKFANCLTRALNRISMNGDLEYHLHFLAPGQILFREGDIAKSVYVVRRGHLMAYKGSESTPTQLGEIHIGEFVGEMAHINQEPRSATVRAIEDCELIEIPNGSLDLVLFSKPAWAQALMRTLSRRLKQTNETLAKSTKK